MNKELRITNKDGRVPHSKKGFGLIEVLIATAIILTSLVALAAASQISFRVIADSLKRIQAEFLAEEGLEVVRMLRDESWSSNITPKSTGVLYYPSFSTSTNRWVLEDTELTRIDGIFSREIIFEDVYRRNSDEDIISSSSPYSKHIDPGTREIISQIHWGNEQKVELRTYITDLFKN